MKITKFGQCCLLIEEQGVRILTDPGTLSTKQNELTNIHVILITHEHADHFHVDSVKAVLKNNPQAKIITNTAVRKLLEKELITATVVEHGSSVTENRVTIEGFGKDHAEIYDPIVPRVQNTGYFIANKLFYPGDAFYNPEKAVDILALPVTGPWCNIKQVAEYALAIKPRIAFPVHDAIAKNPAMYHRVPSLVLENIGSSLISLELEIEYEL